MFGDLDWPINASRRFVSDSWVSCFYRQKHILHNNKVQWLIMTKWYRLIMVSRLFLHTITLSVPAVNSIRMHRDADCRSNVTAVSCSFWTPAILHCHYGFTASDATSDPRLTDFSCSTLGCLYMYKRAALLRWPLLSVIICSSKPSLNKCVQHATRPRWLTNYTSTSISIPHRWNIVFMYGNQILTSKCKRQRQRFTVKEPLSGITERKYNLGK